MEWITTKRNDDAGFQIVDPIVAFRLRASESNLRETQWWSALVHLDQISPEEFQRRVDRVFQGNGRYLLIPPVVFATGQGPDEGKPQNEQQTAPRDAAGIAAAAGDAAAADQGQPIRTIIPIFARPALLEMMNTPDNPFGVRRVQLGMMIDESVLNFDPPPLDASPIEVDPGTVIMAVIDDGIAIAHELFRKDAVQSRVDLAYVMDAEDPNSPLTFGRVLFRDEIDTLLAAHTQAGLLDDAGFYRAAGIIDFSKGGFAPTALRRSHGTHTTSMAAGYLPAEAPETRPIICAALPSRVTEDTSGHDLAPSLGLALLVLGHQASRYVLRGGGRPPVVLNFSYGNYDGPHDGTGEIEQMLEDWIIEQPGQTRRVVLPAGNGNIARIHAQLKFGKKDPTSTELRLLALPDDRTASFVQMWLPYRPGANLPAFVKVEVTPPGGPTSPPILAVPGSGAVLVNDSGGVLATISYHFIGWPTRRGQITLALSPTASLAANAALAPAGAWRIEVTNIDMTPKDRLQVRIRRDDTLPGYAPHGRQALFDNADYRRFDELGAPLAVDPPGSPSTVRRAGTLSGFGTGTSPIVVAGFARRNGLLADYSSAGPITPTRGHAVANREGPDASARSDLSPAVPGVIGAGSGSGSFVRLNGTSVSAPLVARAVADGLEAGHPADRAWITVEAALQDPAFPPPKPAISRSGGGRMSVTAPFWRIEE